jgi:hypothetical protein
VALINAKINFKSIQFKAPTHYKALSQVEQEIDKDQNSYNGLHDQGPLNALGD